MSLPSASDKKVSSFPFFSKKEWADAAKQELEGADPAEKLRRRIDEVDIFPYYDQNDRPQVVYQLPASQNEFLGSRAWMNMPWIQVNDAKEANEQALESLNSGAGGILFELRAHVNASVLLKKIELPYCSIGFMTDSGQEDFFYEMSALAKAKKYSPESLTGTIFWKEPPAKALELMEHFKSWDQFHPLGIMADEFPSPTDEIGALLARAAKQLEYFSGTEIKYALNSVAFSVSVGTDFFLEIAKLKALRFLWQQVARAYDPHYTSSIFIHTLVKPWENLNYDPHGNMLMGTTAAMSAILGGCDSLTVQPADPDHAMMARVARNVSSILHEESHLGKVSDPTAGSYYLENLCDQLASRAWEKFQRLVKS